jgi:hypothetical protein
MIHVPAIWMTWRSATVVIRNATSPQAGQRSTGLGPG